MQTHPSGLADRNIAPSEAACTTQITLFQEQSPGHNRTATMATFSQEKLQMTHAWQNKQLLRLSHCIRPFSLKTTRSGHIAARAQQTYGPQPGGVECSRREILRLLGTVIAGSVLTGKLWRLRAGHCKLCRVGAGVPDDSEKVCRWKLSCCQCCKRG
jgi:hypothetical protein